MTLIQFYISYFYIALQLSIVLSFRLLNLAPGKEAISHQLFRFAPRPNYVFLATTRSVRTNRQETLIVRSNREEITIVRTSREETLIVRTNREETLIVRTNRKETVIVRISREETLIV